MHRLPEVPPAVARRRSREVDRAGCSSWRGSRRSGRAAPECPGSGTGRRRSTARWRAARASRGRAAGTPRGLPHLLVAQPRVAGEQPQLVEGEAGPDVDRERARDDLEVELAVVAVGDLVEAVVAVGDHAREDVEAAGRALRVGLRADLRRQARAPRSAGPGRDGRARACAPSRRSIFWKARSAIFSSTVESLSGRKLQRSAQANSPRRRSRLAGWIASVGMRQSPASIHSRLTASRSRWEASTPAPVEKSTALGSVAERGAVLTSCRQ